MSYTVDANLGSPGTRFSFSKIMENYMRKLISLSFLATVVLMFSLVAGCSDSDTAAPQEGTGRMQVFLIDAPGDYDEVNVEVIEVRIHRGDADSLSGWHTISLDTTYVNLLDLTGGNFAVLADSTLPAGHYTQVRLILGDNNTVVVDGVSHDLEIPSSAQSGLKLNHPFDISDGTIYAVTLDFDADRSIHVTGNGQYKMRPVIRLMVNAMSGALRGVVEPVDARAMILSTAMIPAGMDSMVAYADTLTGHFNFPMLMAGIYDLEISATAGAYRDTVLVGVTVIAGQETDLGTIVLEAE